MSVPKIKKMEVFPVAGYDSMLLNLSGAHGPFFTRNIVVLTADNGAVGVGEVPGGQKITDTLEHSKMLVEGSSIGEYKATLQKIRNKFSYLDKGGRGNQTFDLRIMVHALTGVETALLDLLGKYLHVPVAALLGDGQQREHVGLLGYLFWVGDTSKTDLPYLQNDDDTSEWGRLRRKPVTDVESLVRLARASYDKYGFKTFKLKGGVFDGEKEVAAIKGLHEAFPDVKLDLDPNGGWYLKDALHYADELKQDLHYIEDPCGAEDGFSGREILAEFQQLTHMPVATNMVDTDWRQMSHALALNSISIPLADPHFWTMEGAVRVAQLCDEFNLNWGIHSNNHFDISLAMIANTAAAAPGNVYDVDTHWIWQDGQYLTKNPYQIKNGQLTVPRKNEGLGVEIDMEAVKKAHQLYVDNNLGARDDAITMQYLIPGWKFDPKRPAMVR
ncbi:MAG: glucarate dehydratase [Furfurilactobacillus sp.]|uniref:enolase C-terminal domain-like protein n=1 Tax=Furfurilactobacillus sp. TaxID=2767911 RepID=UPI00258F2CEC|nr:enolase C-terminal domain-like protein [Furfurilactobacillus sp.]MCH4010961.1 glucarate dehydratase [Furfurilactobacillus sp.]MCH4036853.1 glucarate dehydratase [Furfurilactobacillus sp.]MCH4114201.1 glucarate dehydratase [Furfurilactobacillus sp.]MCH4132976.1 glucarate dehydratase [Furfurilactobacillus sp.]MCI1339408.1 glucarate dehydratase [Furfurilactobacillus sp.]